jgi:hypothetical protein
VRAFDSQPRERSRYGRLSPTSVPGTTRPPASKALAAGRSYGGRCWQPRAQTPTLQSRVRGHRTLHSVQLSRRLIIFVRACRVPVGPKRRDDPPRDRLLLGRPGGPSPGLRAPPRWTRPSRTRSRAVGKAPITDRIVPSRRALGGGPARARRDSHFACATCWMLDLCLDQACRRTMLADPRSHPATSAAASFCIASSGSALSVRGIQRGVDAWEGGRTERRVVGRMDLREEQYLECRLLREGAERYKETIPDSANVISNPCSTATSSSIIISISIIISNNPPGKASNGASASSRKTFRGRFRISLGRFGPLWRGWDACMIPA